MKYVIVDNLNDIIKLDKLRKKINNMTDNEESYYLNQIKTGKMVALAVYVDEEIIGGVYISDNMSSLFIENIFVDENYRGKGIATSLISYVIKNKKIFEKYYKKELFFSKLEPNSESIINFYKKLGYSDPNELNVMKRRA